MPRAQRRGRKTADKLKPASAERSPTDTRLEALNQLLAAPNVEFAFAELVGFCVAIDGAKNLLSEFLQQLAAQRLLDVDGQYGAARKLLQDTKFRRLSSDAIDPLVFIAQVQVPLLCGAYM